MLAKEKGKEMHVAAVIQAYISWKGVSTTFGADVVKWLYILKVLQHKHWLTVLNIPVFENTLLTQHHVERVKRLVVLLMV